MLAAHWAEAPGFGRLHDGADQGRYLEAARAWATLDLTPSRHHYLPLYPLLGAAFVWLTPAEPFLVPDILCLLACLTLFMRIGRRIAPGWNDAGVALCFTVAVLSGRWIFFRLWVVPWSSTGSAPLQFAAVLLALRLGERIAAGRAFALGWCLALLAGFRPSDAAVLAASCGLYAASALARARSAPGVWAMMAAAGATGIAAGLAPWVAAHAAIFGSGVGPYLRQVASIGFEWRLLPLRWVLLVVDPRPLLPAGNGAAEVLPWIVPGVAGMLLSLMPRAGQRVAPMAFVAGTVALHWCLYLTYRDLNAEGIWRFALIHYFKWTFPFIVLWAAQFAWALLAPPPHGERHARVRAGAAAVAALLLFAWRPILRKPEAVQARLVQEQRHVQSLRLSLSPSRVDQALALGLSGGWDAIHAGQFVLHAGGRALSSEVAFKMMPVPSGALLMPLRPLPPGAATLDLPAGIAPVALQETRLYKQALVFGVPCAFFPHRTACRPP